jgi:hypothetical protein
MTASNLARGAGPVTRYHGVHSSILDTLSDLLYDQERMLLHEIEI